ncbi:major facilitator superfamily domain-containing protein [Massariosphaeria phaeospora]|uniref:Major facilitator superfamily domain-containing protein n=1 Tax=Massariosphaeria phaeospora TaxID=100035 RepID=A0A7C8M5D6_9PLEO|nr:major facilitator superfamily domain-containing protein [Massariosphaeria phaeospora]
MSPNDIATTSTSPNSDSTTSLAPYAEGPGAAQFVSNLSPRQLQHLQFAVPASKDPQRFSQFLEGPRQTPIPNRFTFEAIDATTRKQKAESSGKQGRDRAGSKSAKNVQAGSKASILSGGKHGRGDSQSSSDAGQSGRERSATVSSTAPSIDLLKEVERVRTAVDIVDWRFYITGACIFLLNLVVAWDITSLPMALPTIATALHGSAVDSFWLGISFLVTATVFIPLFATFSNIFGRKAMLLSALTFFTVGALISGISHDITGLHIGCSVQGIGAGGICVLSKIIVSDLVSVADRWKWAAMLGAIWAVGAITGPILGNALAENSQWRWIFWINLPFSIPAFIVLAVVAQLRSAAPGSVLVKLRNIDWFGSVLFTGSLMSVFLGLTWGGTLHAWSSVQTLLPLQFGLIGLVLFCLWSRFSSTPSIISLEGFSDPSTLVAYFGAMIQGVIVFAALYFLPFYFSVAKHTLSHTHTGVQLISWTIPLAILAGATVVAIGRWGCWRWAIWSGWGLVVLGIALTSLLTRVSSSTMWVAIAIVSGSGVGILYPSLSAASQLAVSHDEEYELTRAVTNFVFFQFLGQALGVSVGTSIFQNQFSRNVRNNTTFEEHAAHYTNDAVALVSRIRATESAEESSRTQMQEVYVESLNLLWIILAALAGAALLASLLIKKKDMKRNRDVEMRNFDTSGTV